MKNKEDLSDDDKDKKNEAMITIMSTESLADVANIRRLFREKLSYLRFPLSLPCSCKKGVLKIRSYDDFPYKSKKCPYCSRYFLKLIQITADGHRQL